MSLKLVLSYMLASSIDCNILPFRECFYTLVEHSKSNDQPPNLDDERARAWDLEEENLEEEAVSADYLEEVAAFENGEADVDTTFIRKKRLSCFAHNLMLAVSSVSNSCSCMNNRDENIKNFLRRWIMQSQSKLRKKRRTP